MKTGSLKYKILAVALTAGTSLPLLAGSPYQAETITPSTLSVMPSWLERGRQMYSDGDYQGAVDQLRRAVDHLSGCRKTDTQLLLMRSTIMLSDKDVSCPLYFRELACRLGNTPAGFEVHRLMGDFYFFAGNMKGALREYQDVPGITRSAQYAYRLALCYLLEDPEAAVPMLTELTAGNSPYRIAAEFYLAYADYSMGNYYNARAAFERVMPRLSEADRKSAGPEGQYLPTILDARYFLAQIDFVEGAWQQAFEQSRQALTGKLDTDYRRELNRIAGESLFKLGRTREAEPYLQAYVNLTASQLQPPAAGAAYALGAIAYGDGRDEEARKYLEPLLLNEEEYDGGVPVQGAALLLGQMAGATGDYSAAALYFDKAYRLGADPNLTERALYNLIAAMGHGADSPFASATELPERFLQLFPGSTFEPRVREYLSAAYYRDKDYTRALSSLDKIKHPTASQAAARQLVLYELGVSEVSNKQYAEAEKHLTEAAAGSNPDVAAQAQQWLGQALYEQGKFAASEQAYRQYLRRHTTGANAAQARYDTAYALYMQDKFAEAAQEYSRALAMTDLPSRLRTDATLRLADCYYYQRKYAEAATLYTQAGQQTDGDPAYAAMRAAMMQGLQGNSGAEITGLKSMIATYPDSRWRPAAMYELASAQVKQGDNSAATATFTDLAAQYPQLEEGRRAQLQLANLLMRSGDNDKAIQAYMEVIRRWPTGDEAKAANIELRRLMSDQGRVADYAAFMNSVPGAPKVDNAELEHLAFQAADNRLIADPANPAPMQEYLKQYPDGLYLAAALWRLAQAQDETRHYNEALEAIDRLERERPDAQQLPEALLMRGSILEDLGRGAEALASFRKAEKMLGANTPAELYAGIMRLTTSPAERLEYATRLRKMPALTADQIQEADYYQAVALDETGNPDAALTLFKSLAAHPSTLYGARSAVAAGELLIKLKKYKEAESLLNTFTAAGTPHAYWLARGYIALADAVGAQGRKALAREYLNALRNNYPGSEADIKELINKGLKQYK